jgi:uncharacterized protein (DUF1697 family)
MTTEIALLRGINVGGRNMVAMADLKKLLETLKFTGGKSLLQSGNLVFQSGSKTGADLERLLATETEKRLKLSVEYFTRTAEEWEKVVANNPFPDAAENDPSHLVVMFFKTVLEEAKVEDLRATIKGGEIVRADGRQLYMVYPTGIGQSKLTNAVVERKLGVTGTARNWNTVLKLLAMARG